MERIINRITILKEQVSRIPVRSAAEENIRNSAIQYLDQSMKVIQLLQDLRGEK
jgi:hypothetical protein